VDVQIEQLTQFGFGGLLGGADLAAAGIVDQDVDASVPGLDVGDRRGARRRGR
jgi:hypothetical protein